MKKQGFTEMLLLTVGVALFVIVMVLYYVQHTGNRMTEFSFERLGEMTEDAAREYRETIDRDVAILNSLASMAARGDLSDVQMTDMLNTFSYRDPYIRLQLLTKDGRLLDQNGRWTQLSDKVNFAEEAENGTYLSGRCTDFLEPERLVIRLAAPVVREGETVAILYGVLALEEASEKYQVNDFGGNAFVMLVDGNTGDVLLDTWHGTLGNIMEYGGREIKTGDTPQIALDNMQNDRKGNLVFTSKTRGMTIYLHYEPVRVNHLSAVIGVTEEVALSGTRTIVENLYTMALIIFLVLAMYTVVIVAFLLRVNRSIYRMSVTDQGTGLLNRSAYEDCLREKRSKVLPDVACIYLDANGLHELNNQYGHAAGDAMLRAVAEALKMLWQDTDIYRIGGDEFVLFPKETEEEDAAQKIQQLKEMLVKQHYSISAGFARRQNEKGLEQVVLEADQDMLKNKAEHYREQGRRDAR